MLVNFQNFSNIRQALAPDKGVVGLNWRGGSAIGAFSVNRSGAANVFGADGTLVAANANDARITYDGHIGERLGLLIEEADTNYAASDMAGAVVGPVGSGGALPTGWHTSNGGATTISVVEVSGARVRLRFQGTSATTILLQMASTTAITVAASEAWTVGYRCRLVSGAMPSLAGIGFIERNSGGTYVNNYGVNFTPQADILFQEEFNHVVVAGARLCPKFQFSGSASYDFTVDIEAVQTVKKSSLGSFVAAASGATATRNADDVTLASNIGAIQSILIDADASRQTATGTLLQIDDGTDNNRIELALSASSLVLRSVVSGAVTSTTLGTWVPMMRGRVALSIGATSVSAAYNGADAAAVAAIPSGLTTLKLGRGASGYWNSTIGRYRSAATAWDAVTLKSLSRYGVFDNFTRADNSSLGSTITGESYVQFDPTANGNTSIVKMAISGNKATTAPSGQTATYSYTAVDAGATLGAIGVAYTLSSTAAGPLTLISAAGATGSVSADILAGAGHPNFRHPAANGIAIGLYSTTLTNYGGGAYQSAPATGTDLFAVAKFGNDAVVCRGYDGRLQRGASANFAAVRSRYGIFEASRGNISDAMPSFSALKIDLAAA